MTFAGTLRTQTVHFWSLARGFRSLSDFAEDLSTNVDIVFPVIHGRFGEDGGIQVLGNF